MEIVIATLVVGVTGLLIGIALVSAGKKFHVDVKGMKAEDVIARLEGIQCGGKPTSCPDQLSQAIRQAM